MKKERLDIVLVERGFFDSREKAKRSIMAGQVLVDGYIADKPGTKISLDHPIVIKGNPIPYVSRGGLKLEKALKEFSINLTNKVVMDIGSSTGGFTDCMLQNGAKKVFAVDVGYGQLDWSLRENDKVVVMERTNIRNVIPEMIGEEMELITVDVSFISLKLVLPVVKKLLKDHGEVVVLIKPQFEAGKEFIGKNGVVRDKQIHKKVLVNVLESFQQIGFKILNLSFSPVKGPKGNIEFLAHLSERDKTDPVEKKLQEIEILVGIAHETLLQ